MPNTLTIITPPIFHLVCALITYASLLFCSNAKADIIVVTRIDSELDTITTQQLSALWLKQSLYVGDTAIEVIDLPVDHPARQLFYGKVVGKTGNKLSAYWAKQVFRGNGFPPTTADSETAVIEWLMVSKNRLAYISDKPLDQNLKIIYRLLESQGIRNNEN